ncbi:MAG: TonB family protein [Nitrospira sp.]|jgi:colicin import membrane protein|nr:TonB family protein [Nitrospira sp.]
MVQASAQSHAWLDEDVQGRVARHLRLAVVWSMVLHVVVLVAVTWVRWPRHGEQPLASIEVSLASLPAPSVKMPEPVKAPAKPVEAAKPPAPAPPVKMAPVAPPVARPEPAAPARPAHDPMRDLMKGVDLPPDAPKFGDFSPTDRPKKVHEPVAPAVSKLKLPDVPVAQDAKELPRKPSEVKPRTSLSEEMNRELDEELSKIKKVELPKESKPLLAEAPAKSAPQRETKIPSVKAVDTVLKVPGSTSGASAYLARVRQKVSSVWSAPQVDVTAQVYSVVVKFRLHRNGTVSGVAIEQSSGNEYYDLAGKRAVMNAEPLPGFPPELTESFFDAHFTFTVGEPNG